MQDLFVCFVALRPKSTAVVMQDYWLLCEINLVYMQQMSATW